MDYYTLTYGVGFIIGGICVAIGTFYKGWKGFKNASATPHQRRVDVLGGMFFCLCGVGMIAGGIFGVIFATQEIPHSRMSNMTSAPASYTR